MSTPPDDPRYQAVLQEARRAWERDREAIEVGTRQALDRCVEPAYFDEMVRDIQQALMKSRSDPR